MDATDENTDVKFHRASTDLLLDIEKRLGHFKNQILDSRECSNRCRYVANSQALKIIDLLEPFQEWPQLLDPLLPKLANAITQPFLQYLAAEDYASRARPTAHSGQSPVPYATCCILNTLCKVRGVKVVTKFLDNEPKYLEPMLRGLFVGQSHISWQERYVMLLWLSHLVLTPFDLESVSSLQESFVTSASLPEELEPERLPGIAVALVAIGLEHFGSPGKERESASQLLVRIALRPDMQRAGLLHNLVEFVRKKLQEYSQKPAASVYECLGYLSVLSGISKSGSDADVRPVLQKTYNFCLGIVQEEAAEFRLVRAFAPARKMLVGILRTLSLHAISATSWRYTERLPGDFLQRMLEEIVQYFLDALGDKDTPVRMAASKALSMVAQNISESLRIEVVQAVLDSLEEDVFHAKSASASHAPFTFLTSEMRDLSAVDPSRWHGLLLTLGHLLFRRTAPSAQLPSILRALVSGLEFEQRSALGASIGGSVRDAACFGFWSVARKYATSDLQQIKLDDVLLESPYTSFVAQASSVLQFAATQLVVAACLDPSGNIRRGSSAALQELVGRHPDTIVEGIALVQVVDYHAVARRSRAMLDVTEGAARLHDIYRWALLSALFEWRGIRAIDDNSRRVASLTISKLVTLGAPSDVYLVLDTARTRLKSLPRESTKTVVETRHGLLLAISYVLETIDPGGISDLDATDRDPTNAPWQLWCHHVSVDGPLLGNIRGRFDSQLILEGAARFISSLVQVGAGGHLNSTVQTIEVLNVCLTQADHEATLLACADAVFEIFKTIPMHQRIELIDSWLNPDHRHHPAFSCKGRILAFGRVYSTIITKPSTGLAERQDRCQSNLFAQLRDFIQGEWPVETKVMALRSLKSTIGHGREESLEEPLSAALDNYTNDQRGDVGSLARLEAIKVVSFLLADMIQRHVGQSNVRELQPLIQRVFRLGFEKLDKVRFEAWKCIEVFLAVTGTHFTHSFSHIVDVSSERYYVTLLQFLEVPWLQTWITQGVVHSITSSTESLMHVSRAGLVREVLDVSRDGGKLGILETLVALLDDSLTDERQVTPILETIVFVLEQKIELLLENDGQWPIRKLWNLVRKAHSKSTNIRKLEAAIRIYGELATNSDTRRDALCQLRDFLLHPFPNIRNSAAEAFFIAVPNELLLLQDWSRPRIELKEIVKRLGKEVSELTDPA